VESPEKPAAAGPTSTTDRLPEKVSPQLRYMWSITKFVWKALCAALLPIGLAQMPTLLPKVAEHLARHDPHRNRESALERCLRTWSGNLAESLEPGT